MRIRSLLTASAAIGSAVTLAVLAALIGVTREAERDFGEQAEAQQVARDVANLLSLTNQFVVFGGERVAQQWGLRHERLLAAVDRGLRRHVRQPAELVELRRQVSDLPVLFSTLGRIAAEPPSPLAARRRDLLLGRLMAATQDVVESRQRWAASIGRQQRRDERVYSAMVLAAPALLLAVLLSLGFFVGRRVLAPLARLQAAANAIRSGDLAARCAGATRDELGDAARAVDAMALELQRHGAALAESEHRLRQLADSLPALVVHVDADQRYTFVNAHVSEVSDVPRDAMLGRTLRELRGETVYGAIAPQVAQALAGATVSFEGDATVRGAPRHYHSTYVPDVDDAGAVRGFYAMTFDITARKQAELRQAASERRLADIADNIPAMVAYIDRDHRYQYANENYRRWLGHDPAWMVGRTVADVLGAAVYAQVHGNIDRALDGRKAQRTHEGRLAGQDAYFLVEYIPDRAADGGVRGCYALTVDITDRRQAELRLARNEQRLLELTNSLPATVGYFDMAQRCQYANDTALHTRGIERSQLPGLALRSTLGEAAYSLHQPYVDEVLQGRRAVFEGTLPFDGRAAHFQAHLIPDGPEAGEQRGFYLMTFDITALKEAQQKQARVERQLRAITDNLPVLISYIDDAQRYVFANRTFETWLGVDPDALLNRHVGEVAQPPHAAQHAAALQRALAGERCEFEAETVMRGELRHLHNVYIPDRRPGGAVAGAYALSTDVTALKQVERRLNELARADTLTGLPNRRRFDERLPEATSRAARSGQALALIFLDIDHFKSINDRFGHAAGDAVLKQFAERLKGAVRITDMPARLAGDEFVVLLEGLSTRQQAESVARKVVAAIGDTPFDLEGAAVRVTASVGVAYSQTPHAESELLACADEALYQAKDAGRNTFRSSCTDTVRS